MGETIKNITRIMEKIAPSYLAESWDNVGLQIGYFEREVNKILVCLEVTQDTIDEAIQKNIDMIICHHPLIFKSVKKIILDDPIQSMIYRLIKHDISLYCAHTNLDVAKRGTSDVLADTLNLVGVVPLVKTNKENYYEGLGRVGQLEESITLSMLCEKIKEKLNMKTIKFIGNPQKEIKKVGLCTGSGAEFMNDAYKALCDCYITGDVKYHDAQYANGLGMSVIDAGHFETENIICRPLSEVLKDHMKINQYNVEVLLSEKDINPFQTI